MSATAGATLTRRASATGRMVGGAGAVIALALGLGVFLQRHTPPAPLLVGAGGAAALGLAALVLVRYEAAVVLGLVLFAVVRFQPAPTDGVFALVIAVALLSGRFHVSRVPSLVLTLLAALLALNLVSAVNSVSAGTAASFFAITLYLALFGAWLTSHVNGRPRARRVLIGYLAAALVSAALGVLAVVTPIPGRSSLLFDGRAEGLFKDPNVFGPFLVPALLILLDETVTPHLLGTGRRLKVAGVLLLALAVLFSYSRGAWLNLAVGLVVMLAVLLLRRRSARTATRLLALLLVMILGGAATVAVTGSRSFLQQRAALQAYDASRFAAQQAGITLGEQHPLGIGPGQFDIIEPLSAHNLYVRVFAEQGPLGLLLLLALVLTTLAFAARSAARGRDTYGIGSAALLAAWCGLLVNSALIDTLHWRHLWLLAALIWAAAIRGTTPPRAGRLPITHSHPLRAPV